MAAAAQLELAARDPAIHLYGHAGWESHDQPAHAHTGRDIHGQVGPGVEEGVEPLDEGRAASSS